VEKPDLSNATVNTTHRILTIRPSH